MCISHPWRFRNPPTAISRTRWHVLRGAMRPEHQYTISHSAAPNLLGVNNIGASPCSCFIPRLVKSCASPRCPPPSCCGLRMGAGCAMFRAVRNFFIALVGLVTATTVFAADLRELPADGYAAIVNDRVITVGDVLEFIQADALQMRDEFSGEELARRQMQAYEKARELLIENALIVEEFKALKGNLPDRIVDDRVKEFIFDQFQNDRARFLEALAADQITLEEWRERVRERLIVSILRRQEVTERVEVSPGALQSAYTNQMDKWKVPASVKLRLIVLRLNDNDDLQNEEQRALAIRARGRILAGEDFAELAREISQDSKADSGGDWGWRTLSDFSAELQKAIKPLKNGEISDVIETPGVIYLALVEDRKPAHTRTLDEVRPEIEQALRQAEGERLYNRWIDRLKKKFFVQVF